MLEGGGAGADVITHADADARDAGVNDDASGNRPGRPRASSRRSLDGESRGGGWQSAFGRRNLADFGRSDRDRMDGHQGCGSVNRGSASRNIGTYDAGGEFDDQLAPVAGS